MQKPQNLHQFRRSAPNTRSSLLIRSSLIAATAVIATTTHAAIENSESILIAGSKACAMVDATELAGGLVAVMTASTLFGIPVALLAYAALQYWLMPIVQAHAQVSAERWAARFRENKH